MRSRAAARDATRARIVEAAIRLHTARGILGTSWRDIAEAADVSTGTVYNHFPSLDELVPACGAALMERLDPPSPSDAGPLLDGVIGTAARIERVARHLFAFYERGGRHLHVFPGEDELPDVRAWQAELRRTVDTLVRAAVADLRPSPSAVGLVGALLDRSTFEAFRDRGIAWRRAAAAVAHAAAIMLEKRDGSIDRRKEQR